MKRISKDDHPYEVEIATFLSSKGLASDPKNHCIPIYEALTVPDDPENHNVIVMPLVRGFDCPRFQTVGEAVDFFGQFFEVFNLTKKLL